jgi:acyl-CoA synthetase (AMP-forming)/AMP-acid ligase II
MPTTTLLVPSFLQALRLSERARQIDWSKLRHVGIGSAPLTRHLFETFRGVPIRLLNIYGLTEAGPFLASCDLTEKTPALMDVMPIGHINKRFEWKQSDSGELFIRGPAAQAVYSRRARDIKAPELIPTYDSDGWVATGDAVRNLNGLLYFMHRMDETLNVGGMKVTPSRIEAVFESMPGVRGCIVKARQHAVFGSVLVAMLEIDRSAIDIAKIEKRDLVREAKKRLSSYETPREVEFVERVPRSAIGKKLRHHL